MVFKPSKFFLGRLCKDLNQYVHYINLSSYIKIYTLFVFVLKLYIFYGIYKKKMIKMFF